MFKKHLSPSTERTTIIIIISRLSHGGSRFRKVGSRREGGRVKDMSKVGMRGAESEMMNAREGVAFNAVVARMLAPRRPDK